MAGTTLIGWALAGLIMQAAAGEGFTPLDSALIDVGCSYSFGQDEPPFLLVLTLPPEPDGPSVFLGLDGQVLTWEEDPQANEHFASFRRDDMRLVVRFGPSIEQECGEDCAGSMRSVRVELQHGERSLSADAMEYCGC